MESQCRSERTKAGLARVRKQGQVLGRPVGSKDKRISLAVCRVKMALKHESLKKLGSPLALRLGTSVVTNARLVFSKGEIV